MHGVDESGATAATKARFREREACLACGSRNVEVTWTGRFSDEPVRSWLRDFHYSADLDRALGDQSFAAQRCAECGMAFHRRILTDGWLRRLYSDWISSSQIEAFEAELVDRRPDSAFEHGVQLVKHALRLRHLRGVPAPRLLDFGCGDGKFLSLAATLGFRCAGLEASASRVERAARSNLAIYTSFAELDEHEREPFDCAVLFEVLEHLADPLAVLGAVAERLAQGGILLVEVPNCRGVVVPRTFDEFTNVQPLEHINHFTPATLAELCRRAGFEPLPRIPAHVTTRPLDLLKTEVSRVLRRPVTSLYLRRL